ncbi:MAG: SAM-dependent DNA methyltransferase, partial [Dermatophilaceae bacterium]
MSEQHRAWLALVDQEGPFLAIPPLKRVWPQGMPVLPDAARTRLVDAKPAFEKAWDTWDRDHEADEALPAYRTARDTWVDVVVRDVLGWGELLVTDEAATVKSSARATSPDRTVAVEPTGALVRGDSCGALLWVVDPVAGLRDLLDDGWAASPIDRMEAMLRAGGVPIGVVTDGRWWGLVCARPKAMVASGIVDAQTWVEEAQARDAFAALLHARQLVGGRAEDRLAQLFAESVAAAEE